jgi:hypothetical protein
MSSIKGLCILFFLNVCKHEIQNTSIQTVFYSSLIFFCNYYFSRKNKFKNKYEIKQMLMISKILNKEWAQIFLFV